MEILNFKIKKFQQGTFYARKVKKPTPKKFLIFWEMELASLKLKKLLYFRRKLAKPEKQKKFKFRNGCWFYLLEKSFKRERRKRFSYNYPYKEEKIFELITKRQFFSFHNTAFCTQQAFVYHLLVDFCIVHIILSLFFLFFLQKDFNICQKLFWSLSLLFW